VVSEDSKKRLMEKRETKKHRGKIPVANFPKED
jgi:hypothetical protein